LRAAQRTPVLSGVTRSAPLTTPRNGAESNASITMWTLATQT
jgi:hypothetical protein